jgi:hypothetical protein
LGLVNININEETFDILIGAIAEADYLQNIDLSWNILKPNSFQKLLSEISTN